MKKGMLIFLTGLFALWPVTASASEGIDVSHYQGEINWEQTASDDIDFVIIKATEGTDVKDPNFTRNVKGARRNGIKAGAYHFARFSNDAEAREEAEFFLNTISDVTLDYAVALDLETDNGAGRNTLTSAAKVFMDIVSDKGYEVLLYSGESFLIDNLNRSQLRDYGFWVAKYSDERPSVSHVIWQYTDSGSVRGISGGVDRNIAYKNLSGDGNDTDNESKQNHQTTMTWIQSNLNQKFNTNLTIDGIYGPDTHKAFIKGIQTELNIQFQASLSVDGIYGKATTKSFRNIRRGARGNITELIQAKLYIKGYYDDSIDGIFGKNTLAAVKEFQSVNGLSADGIVGVKTGELLFK